MLTIQALDTKSFLAGDILATNEQIRNSSISDKLSTLRSKFFPQAIEINKKEDSFKQTIIEHYLKHVAPRRFENRREITTQLIEAGAHMGSIEFSFFVIKSLKIMLLIYGKNCDLTEIHKLEKNFYNQGAGSNPEKNLVEEIDNDSDSELIETILEN